MGYITGTLAQADTVQGVWDAVEAELTAVGFVFVEEYLPSVSYRTRVWRSPATLNSRGIDWYFIIHNIYDNDRANVNYALRFTASEKYSTVDHKVDDFISLGTYTNVGVQADGTIDQLPQVVTHAAVFQTEWKQSSMSTLAQTYRFLIMPDAIIGQSDGGTSVTSFYAGFYEPFVEGIANHVPFCHISPGLMPTSTQPYGSVSRLPEAAGTDPGNYNFIAGTAQDSQFGPYGAKANLDRAHPLYGNIAFGGRVPVVLGSDQATTEPFRGLLSWIRTFPVTSTTNVGVGSTITIGTTVWACIYAHASHSIWMKTTDLATR